LYFACIVAAAGGFNWSYYIILMSGAILYLDNYFHIGQLSVHILLHSVSPSWIEGLTMTSAILGTVIGMLVGGNLADRIGRKQTLIFAGALLLVTAIGTAVPNDLALWNLLRFVGGVGGGLAALVAPIYISEIAPRDRRGLLVTFNQMAVVFGAFFANLTTWVIARHLGSDPQCWRWMFASACIPITIFLFGARYIPETPRWLLMAGQREEGRAVLARVRGDTHAEETIHEIQKNLGVKTGSYRELFARGIRIATLVSNGLAIFDQWTGVSTLIYYAPSLFVRTGLLSNADAIGNTVFLRIGDMLWTLFAVFYVDKFGRRPLLLVGMLGTSLGQFLMGACFHQHSRPLFVLLVFFLCEAAFGISLPPVGWLVTSEIFPTRLRARGMALHGFVRLGSSLFLAQIFPPLIEFFRTRYGSEAGAFWLFMVFCVAGFVFCYLLIPETKGRSLEEISEFYVRKGRAAEA
jgi:SP family arabinose:H+ symporter-like MFS transporter